MRPTAVLWDESAATPITHRRIASASAAKLAPRAKTFDATSFERIIVPGSLVVLSVAYFYAAIARSITDHFWMDEVLAITAAGQVSLRQTWNVIWAGTDFSPPTYHFLLHGFVKAFGGAADSRLVWRFPSIAAVYGAAWCTYRLVLKSDLSRLAAALAFGVVLAFALFGFAIQVRQYALLALGLAAALLIWAGMENTRAEKARAFGLWLVLAACLSLHFYGIVVVATIGAAELIYWIDRRRFRIAVWTALVLTAPVELALYPLAAHLATFNAGDTLAPGYYAKPTLNVFLHAVFDVVDGGLPGLWALLLAIAVLGAAHVLSPSGARSSMAEKSVTAAKASRCSAIEIVMIALCLLPVMTFAFSFFVTKTFSARYMAADALLPAVAAAYVLDKLPSRQVVVLALVPFMAGVLLSYSRAPDPIADALAAVQKSERPLPVVVGAGQLYIELMQAADARTRARLVFLKTPIGAVNPDPTDENEAIRLTSFHPDYRLEEPAAFLGGNPEFYVLQSRDRKADTITPVLAAGGILGTTAASENGAHLIRASQSAPAQQGANRP
jgi:hypothetical protein